MMLWQEVKTLLDEQTGLSFTPINALAPLPSASYSIQNVRQGAIKEGILSLRVYMEDFDELLLVQESLTKLLHIERAEQAIELPHYYLHSLLSTALITEVTEAGLYDLAIAFVMKWKEKNYVT